MRARASRPQARIRRRRLWIPAITASAVSLSGTDTGAGAEGTIVLTVAISVTETGAGAEGATAAIAEAATTETGAGAEGTYALTTTRTATADTGSGADTGTKSGPTGDDFNRVDGNLGDLWNAVTAWTIVTNAAKKNIDPDELAIFQDGLSSNDVEAAYDYPASEDSGKFPNIMARINSPTATLANVTCYGAYWAGDGHEFGIYRITAGFVELIGSLWTDYMTEGNTYHMALQVQGSTIRFYRDGVLKATRSDSTIPTGTYGGFSAYGVNERVDNFSYTSLIVPVDVSSSDTGSGTEPTATMATASATGDSGSGADSATSTASIVVLETSGGVEVLVVVDEATEAPRLDTGTSTETFSLVISISASDTGSGGDDNVIPQDLGDLAFDVLDIGYSVELVPSRNSTVLEAGVGTDTGVRTYLVNTFSDTDGGHGYEFAFVIYTRTPTGGDSWLATRGGPPPSRANRPQMLGRRI